MDSPPERPFLTARWRSLVMLNYEADRATLAGLVPAGSELDFWNGQTFVSVVGFQFLDTRVLGVAIPFHRHFDEVNLRFYVRRKVQGTWRRGVVFIKEIVPRWATAFVARHAYGENYIALPMRHDVRPSDSARATAVSYRWRRQGTWEGVSASYSGLPEFMPDTSQEAFITEHYWGYSRQRGATVEYQVEHPRWRVWRADESSLECDVLSLYGPAFVDALSGAPATALVADGSPVVVRRGRRLT